jgi:mono/diheme cytochrome c family protein
MLLWLVLLALTVLFVWLARRAFKARSRFVKWAGVVFSGLLTMIFALLVVVSGIGLYKLYGPHPVEAISVSVNKTPQQVARGEHIANIICIDCHSQTKQLPLSGGRDVGKDSPVPIGGLTSFNLTPGGPLKDWSDSEIFRALREGVDQQGRTLIAMSALPTRWMSDEDIKAVIAYLRSQPSIPSTTQEGDNPNLLFAVFLGANLLPAPEPVTGVVTAPQKTESPEYGKYIIGFVGCTDCHGIDLSGGKSGGLNPVGPNLRIVKWWTRDQFISTLRTGTTPEGLKLNPKIMQWDIYGHMDDEELGAVYAYLTKLAVTQK